MIQDLVEYVCSVLLPVLKDTLTFLERAGVDCNFCLFLKHRDLLFPLSDNEAVTKVLELIQVAIRQPHYEDVLAALEEARVAVKLGLFLGDIFKVILLADKLRINQLWLSIAKTLQQYSLDGSGGSVVD